MSTTGLIIVVWICGWMAAVSLIPRAKQAYMGEYRPNRNREIVEILDVLSANPPATMVTSLLMWPLTLVAMIGVLVAANVEKKIAADDLEDQQEDA